MTNHETDPTRPDLLARWARNPECDRATRAYCADELASLTEDGEAVQCSDCLAYVYAEYATHSDGADFCPNCA